MKKLHIFVISIQSNSKRYNEFKVNGAEFQKILKVLPIIGKGDVFKYDMHISNGGF